MIKSESSQGLKMSSQDSREEWGLVLPHSTNHLETNFVTLVYTRYIPGIYQLYTNVKVYNWYITGIYQLYLWYIPGIYFDIGIYLVDTWYIPGIYQCNKISYQVVGAVGEDRAPFLPCLLRRHLQAL